MEEAATYAPGQPGMPPRWTSSAKDGVGTSLSLASKVWFTLSHGIFNEIYYPRIDQACVRDMGMIVTDGANFFSEEKRNTHHRISQIAPGVPAFKLENTCAEGRYRIEKEILADPWREVVLQNTLFVPLKGSIKTFRLHILLTPHIANRGYDNSGWLGDYKGVPMLIAERAGITLALACTAAWVKRSVGYVGFSDGWQDLSKHGVLTWSYGKADNGNIALTGEIDIVNTAGRFVLALGFGTKAAEACNRALSSLNDGFEQAKREYIREWQTWQKSLNDLGKKSDDRDLYRISTVVMRSHEANDFLGGLIASLSIPWGGAKGDDDLGGYHLAWPRDLVETAGGLLATGANKEVINVLHYLQSTQEHDGHWPQNMWLDGTMYWSGIQMDETAFPILLVNHARQEKAIDENELNRLWPMVRRAAEFLVRNGPVTQQDRWEEDPGYSPFTLAVEIAALLAAADQADLHHEPDVAMYLRETADYWNDSIERWIYVSGTDLAKKVGVEGYYVRIAPPEISDASSPSGGFVTIKNRPPGQSVLLPAQIVGPDALALVRFGLRSADDPRIVNTVRVIDAILKVDTPQGPAWHRYNDDGYGEHSDGSAFDGTGIGRVWPLITGERAHYELAAGRPDTAEELLHAIEAFANQGGLIPEQVWDAADIPERELFFGKPSGSAMPLVWAHAEYVKLLRSLKDRRVFDMPAQTVQRYLVEKKLAIHAVWRYNHKCRSIPAGKILRLELLSPAVVHWSHDQWVTVHDQETRPTGLGVYIADLPVTILKAGTTITFTFYWHKEKKWEGADFNISITNA